MKKSLYKLGMLLALTIVTVGLNTSSLTNLSSSAAACFPEKCRANCIASGQTGGACFEGLCICFIE
jgi:hypothetical protein